VCSRPGSCCDGPSHAVRVDRGSRHDGTVSGSSGWPQRTLSAPLDECVWDCQSGHRKSPRRSPESARSRPWKMPARGHRLSPELPFKGAARPSQTCHARSCRPQLADLRRRVRRARSWWGRLAAEAPQGRGIRVRRGSDGSAPHRRRGALEMPRRRGQWATIEAHRGPPLAGRPGPRQSRHSQARKLAVDVAAAGQFLVAANRDREDRLARKCNLLRGDCVFCP
jgi:hypothetical protein